jgi:MarR family transcriptional regulator, multiple antibiotic resistance protein MarR
MEFFDALVRYEVALWSAVDHELSRQDQISLGQLYALRVLDGHDGRARVQDLSDDIGITVGAASKLVDRLERAGLAARTPNPANRRSSLIALTAAGEQALTSGMTVCRAAVARAVGQEDVGVVTAVLQQLNARLAGSGLGLAA